ncbi:MAG: lactonase family protein [Cyclobacteriaceae bacterium]
MKYASVVIIIIVSFLGSCGPKKSEKQVDKPETTEQMTSKLNIFIGTYTSEDGSQGIYQVQLDTASGEFGQLTLIAETPSPSYLALSEDKSKLYAVNELVPDGTLSVFEKSADGIWKETSKVSSLGDAPCHVALNDNESLIAVANYVTGNVSAYPLNADGDLLDQPSLGQHAGTGPNTDRQEGPHAHFIQFSKDQKFLYAVDLGIDEIKAYPVDANGIGEAKTAIQLTPGDGPRHFVFHPTKDIAYVVNELSNSVIAVNVYLTTGEFTEFDRETTLPEDFTEHSQCADIHISSDGRFLYASNRGHHSIAAYAIADDGSIDLIDIRATEGEWPRNFMLTPNERHLLVANEWSDNVVLFDRDLKTGMITYSGKQIKISKPVCLIN